MKNTARRVKGEYQKDFIKIFNSLCHRHNRGTVWSDFIVMAAISISNAVDSSNAEQRAKSYHAIEAKYDEQEREAMSQMLGCVMMGIDEDVEQDFLGELFMALELGNDYNGQFFTPYSVCVMMSKISGSDAAQRIAQDGWIAVNDCACGAGALLIAFANECTRMEINYQTSVLFVGQDVDLVAGCMCYIQLSLLGCPGYIVIADTLSKPALSHDKRGLLPVHGENVWYTPFYFRTEWHYRRLFAQMSLMTSIEPALPEPTQEPPAGVLFTETKAGQLSLF